MIQPNKIKFWICVFLMDWGECLCTSQTLGHSLSSNLVCDSDVKQTATKNNIKGLVKLLTVCSTVNTAEFILSTMRLSHCKALEIILTGKHILKDWKKHNQGKSSFPIIWQYVNYQHTNFIGHDYLCFITLAQ